MVRAEAWGSTGRRAGAQGFHAAVARTSQPLADGTLGDTERLGNLTLLPALLVQLPSTKATALAPIPWNISPVHGPYATMSTAQYYAFTPWSVTTCQRRTRD